MLHSRSASHGISMRRSQNQACCTLQVHSGVTLSMTLQNFAVHIVKGNVVRTNVYHKYIKDLKLSITIDFDGFIY